jgi:cysteine desulfurase
VDTVGKIYLDYGATTPLDPRVLEVMLPYFSRDFGNPSSIHAYGQEAETAVENAREIVANLLNARSDEILFTGCGTESDNLAIQGAAFAERHRKNARHILITPVEHHAVLATAQMLESRHGFEVDYLPVDLYGRVDPADVASSIRPDTAVVSVIYANNEIGTINPIAEIGQICRDRGVVFHSDAVQAAAHLPMDVQRDRLNLLTLGAHKFYGPKGVGALYVRRGTPIVPIQMGGKQEAGLRAGTQNVPYIVGLAEAFRLASEDLEKRTKAQSVLRDWLIAQVLNRIPRSKLSGHPVDRLPNHASFVFEGVDGSALLILLDAAGFACSSGSACKVGTPEASEVLTAIGLSKNWTLGSLRVTIGRDTTLEMLEAFVDALTRVVASVRAA